MNYANFVCDLHGHTDRSDGNDTPYEFLMHARERKMKIIAITDHDKVPPQTVMVNGTEEDIHSFADSLGMKLIRGTEISCETTVEDVHLVCFRCQWDTPFFKELDQFVVQSKIDSYRQLLERLKEKNMPLSWEEILENHGHPIEESKIQKKMIFNMMAEKGYMKDWSAAKLYVKSDTALSVMRRKPDRKSVV